MSDEFEDDYEDDGENVDLSGSTFKEEIVYNHEEALVDGRKSLDEYDDEYDEKDMEDDSPRKFVLKPRQPLRFLKGLSKNGLPFFAFDAPEVLDIKYEEDYARYRNSQPSATPGYMGGKKRSIMHI